MEWVAVSAPSPVAAGGGAITPVGSWMENHGMDLWGLDFGLRSKKSLENKVISGKQEPRRLREQAGFEKETDE